MRIEVTVMTQLIADAVRQAGANFVDAIAVFLPRALITISVIAVGWLIAMILRTLTGWLLARLRFDAWCERLGVTAALRPAGLPSPTALVGTIVFWIVWVGFLLSGVDVLGFAALEGLLDEFARFVPRLLVAILILIAGFVLANFAWRATLLAAVNAKVPSPRVLSGVVRALVMILTAAMALDHIAVARTIVLTAFAIAYGAVMLGLAIAFGVGGGGFARRILEHWFPERMTSDHDEPPHL
jgi:hypothetical protein